MSITAENLCPNCGNELKAVQNLDGGKDYFSDIDLQYDCLICGYRYSYVPENIQDDMKYDSKSLYCTICDKHFNQSSSLKRHMVSHSGERPFCCEECDKTFKTKAALKRHSIIHTGECPFECSTCKRKFNQISNLRKHLVIHSNNCPFYCDVCGKGFNQLSNLKKHMVVHREHKMSSNNIGKSVYSGVLKGSEKSVTRPVLTFVKPAGS
ncbi:zinc finger protein 430-like [Argiope bruennichi]|uniref:Zinc finger protein 99 like protein n=1 Tax=Argiope bruennichi TaxID=94029 RepID=A0A8T0E236_ARGBR|nr:zinc finger protein 430-like [Argiope bruennichi]KAF8764319.1 Zinc finger protein 99 like protein [Argiope bruennichi]